MQEAVLRSFHPEQDREDAHRIWLELGWLQAGQEEVLDLFLAGADAEVAEIEGRAECLVLMTPGTLRYLGQDLTLCGVTGVTTSLVGRKQGLAGRLTARAVARQAAQGAQVAGLGMFEQGFYNQLGFGTGSYEHFVNVDPAWLKPRGKHRTPRRLTPEDWQAVHAGRLKRRRGHGACSITPATFTRGEMVGTRGGFGLGYFDKDELTHHFWCKAPPDQELNRCKVLWLCYRSTEQLHELLSLLHSLGDQVRMLSLKEPPGIQLQDLIDRPFQLRELSEGSKHESRISACAYQQLRICDLQACLEKTVFDSLDKPLTFTLDLHDPIAAFLPAAAPWRGIAGVYTVTLGERSAAEPRSDSRLLRLEASVGAFSRLWLGAASASALAATDELHAPGALLEALDSMRLPRPHFDWDY
jgi:predicted acetyltransferase